MTKEEWLKVEQELRLPFGVCKLVVDGYNLTLEVRQDGMKLVIVPFVNGWMKGEWLLGKTEEAKRFYRPVKKAAWSPAQKQKLTKGLSKASIKRLIPDLDKTFIYYTDAWPSFAPLKRHLTANNAVIELLDASTAGSS